MAREFKTGITAEGDITSSNNLRSSQSAGDEGGQIFLNKAVTNTTIASGVNIDVYQNKLRFWEDGGTNRGFYIDITGGGASVGTNLVSGGSYTLPTATGSVLGGVKIGTNVSIDGSGVISVPRLDSVSHTFTGTTGFTTSSSQSAVTTGSSTALTTTSSFALDTGYSLLNSNTAQTIAGAKTFSTSVSTPTVTAPTTTVGTTISTVTPVTPSTGYITYTTAAAHGLIAGQIITIGNLSPSYTRTNARIFSVPSTTTFVMESSTNIGTSTGQTGSITTALLTIGNSASTIVLTNSPTATLPLFIARKTATQVIAASTSTIVNFSTNGATDLNRGGFTMASGVVTVPLTGYYRIKGTAYWDAAVTTGNNKVALLYVNGAAATRVNAYGGLTYDFITETSIDRVYLESTTGTVDLRVYQTSPSNVSLLSAGGLNNHQYGTSIYIEYLGN